MLRQFYKSVVQLEVISTRPIYYTHLSELEEFITSGDGSGLITDIVQNKVISEEEAGQYLLKHKSPPDFFDPIIATIKSDDSLNKTLTVSKHGDSVAFGADFECDIHDEPGDVAFDLVCDIQQQLKPHNLYIDEWSSDNDSIWGVIRGDSSKA